MEFIYDSYHRKYSDKKLSKHLKEGEVLSSLSCPCVDTICMIAIMYICMKKICHLSCILLFIEFNRCRFATDHVLIPMHIAFHV